MNRLAEYVPNEENPEGPFFTSPERITAVNFQAEMLIL